MLPSRLAEQKSADLTEYTLDSKTVYEGRLIHVKNDLVRLPSGSESTREYLIHPGAAVILAIFENGDILLERQHRYSLRRDFLELPAGKFNLGETDLDCAQREFLEETGYVSADWHYLNTQYPCIGYSNERLVYFLARDLKYKGDNLDHDEFLEILRVPFVEALEMVRDGRICETKTVIGILWWAQFNF